ncbi:MAG: imidazole glycerol phosphate synthase, glutamine amidotransferase subunit [Bacteroidetes bacterium GWF2_38_335]|nr:MAG: imidazole glycerol phosphate synthase, glutamine amidotransferase subunit [Bacteroidetes bacterium GWF2_38_335]OFY76932.1 MAG: imidazole glycerol phosphate synthase, glutamine amidotransferase subunit [Bacteroidetes bacterium RIFOXYA12_FULL_38_20]HBS86784.1 imidazole glycerol phosphate synthase subunit HisH [Bacteroidales bacterium]
MSAKTVIVDYKMGNINSVLKKLNRVNARTVVSSDPKVILSADKIILPGVGHFKKAMQNIISLNLKNTLDELAFVKKTHILGICLGMQLFAKHSEEGDVEGLGWIDADVNKFRISDNLKFKVPHTGWNQIYLKKDSELMKGIPEHSDFYFVHSFHYKCNDEKDVLNETEYEYKFVSAVEKDNIFGVQYHPEKSHDAGEKILENFIKL